jgi:hypothetical protein
MTLVVKCVKRTHQCKKKMRKKEKGVTDRGKDVRDT